MTILPITRKYFNNVTSSPDITFTTISTLEITMPKNLTWFRYFEIPGVGVFRNLPGIRKLIIPSNNPRNIDVKEIEESEIVVDSWDIKILGTENIYPRNFYSRLSEIGDQGKSFTNETFKFPEEKLTNIINEAYGREIKKEEAEVRVVQLKLVNTIHDDEVLCTVQEIQEDWGGHYVHFLTESDLSLPINVIESMTNRLMTLSIISLKYDG